jgi:hypothetical protein
MAATDDTRAARAQPSCQIPRLIDRLSDAIGENDKAQHALDAFVDAVMKTPAREVIAGRLEAIRELIWQLQGVCALTSKAGYAEDGGAEGFATDVWSAMRGAERTLDQIAVMLNPDELLDASEKPNGTTQAVAQGAQP